MTSNRSPQNLQQGSGSTGSGGGHSYRNNHVGGDARAQYGDQYTTNNFNGPVHQSLQNADLSEKISPMQRFMKRLHFPEINDRYESIQQQHDGTCDWLLNTMEWQYWQDRKKMAQHRGILWIKGKPGSGKSTMMRFAARAIGVELEKSVQGLYRSLLYQAMKKLPHLEPVLEPELLPLLEEDDIEGLKLEPLKDLLRLVVENPDKRGLTFLVDALDECDKDDIRDMVTFFESLGRTAEKSGDEFRICFSSRHCPHITGPRGVQLILEKRAEHDEDIARFVNSELRIGPSKRAGKIKAQLIRRASGVFLWVCLVTRILNKQHDRGLFEELEKSLVSVPDTLEKLYNRTLHEVTYDTSDPFPVLQWLFFAPPMDYKELYFAVRSDLAQKFALPWDSAEVTPRDMKRYILNSSRGLAEIMAGTTKVQLIHESARTYLAGSEGLEKLQPRLSDNFFGSSYDDLKHRCQEHISLFLDTIHRWRDEKPAARIVPRELYDGSDDDYDEHRFVNKRGTSQLRISERHPFMHEAVRGMLLYADMAQQRGVSQQAFLDRFDVDEFVKLYNAFVGDLQWDGVEVSNVSLFLGLRCMALHDLEREPLYARMREWNPNFTTAPVMFASDLKEAAKKEFGYH